MEIQFTRRLFRGSIALLLAASACGAPTSDSLDLSKAILTSASSMPNGQRNSAEVSYRLKLDAESLVVIAPADALDVQQLPREASEAQVAFMRSAASMWKGKSFVAISWPVGVSSGTSIDRYVHVFDQLAVVKRANSVLTSDSRKMRLERSGLPVYADA